MKFTFPPESKPLNGYTIKRGIHRGGFGEVYYALSDGGKEVALKLLQQNLEVELRGVSQCLNLKHPNLITIFDIRTDGDDDHWIVMEYISGRGLDQVLHTADTTLTLEETRHWFDGIVAGLGFLHDRGIVHRDLKPANIFREADTVKIGDVGLAKFISESRRSAQTQSVGTVYYMAPEVAHGRYGHEVDIYSLGVILYEMLTGEVPFDGESTAEILMKHLTQPPDLSPLPPRLRPVIARALEKDPAKRIATAGEFAAEFHKALDGNDEPIEIPETSFVPAPQAGGATNSSETGTTRNHHPNPRHEHHQTVHHSTVHRRDPQADPVRSNTWIILALILASAFLVPSVLLAWTVVGGTVVGVRAIGLLTAIGLLAAVSYGVYRLIRHAVASVSITPATAPQASPTASVASTRTADARPSPRSSLHHRPRHGYRSLQLTSKTLRAIPLRQRLGEVSGSLTLAVFCTAAVTAVLCAVSFLTDPGNIGLFALTTLAASWTVLMLSKFWEGTDSDPVTRRLTLAATGVLIGLFASWLDSSLLVDIPAGSLDESVGFVRNVGTHSLLTSAGQPTTAAYVIFFAGLLSLRRWWRQADSFRPNRFRIGSTMLTLLIAYLLSLALAFPSGEWGVTWALAISSVVQLSAIWIPPSRRPKVMEGLSNESR